MNRNLRKDLRKMSSFPIQMPDDYMKSLQIFNLNHHEAAERC